MAHWLRIQTRNLEVVGLIPGLAQWVTDSALPQAVATSQMQPRYSIAVAAVWAGSCSSNSPLAWDLPYAAGQP